MLRGTGQALARFWRRAVTPGAAAASDVIEDEPEVRRQGLTGAMIAQQQRKAAAGPDTGGPGVRTYFSFEDAEAEHGDRWPQLINKAKILASRVLQRRLGPDDYYLEDDDKGLVIMFGGEDVNVEWAEARAARIGAEINLLLRGGADLEAEEDSEEEVPSAIEDAVEEAGTDAIDRIALTTGLRDEVGGDQVVLAGDGENDAGQDDGSASDIVDETAAEADWGVSTEIIAPEAILESGGDPIEPTADWGASEDLAEPSVEMEAGDDAAAIEPFVEGAGDAAEEEAVLIAGADPPTDGNDFTGTDPPGDETLAAPMADDLTEQATDWDHSSETEEVAFEPTADDRGETTSDFGSTESLADAAFDGSSGDSFEPEPIAPEAGDRPDEEREIADSGNRPEAAPEVAESEALDEASLGSWGDSQAIDDSPAELASETRTDPAAGDLHSEDVAEASPADAVSDTRTEGLAGFLSGMTEEPEAGDPGASADKPDAVPGDFGSSDDRPEDVAEIRSDEIPETIAVAESGGLADAPPTDWGETADRAEAPNEIAESGDRPDETSSIGESGDRGEAAASLERSDDRAEPPPLDYRSEDRPEGEAAVEISEERAEAEQGVSRSDDRVEAVTDWNSGERPETEAEVAASGDRVIKDGEWVAEGEDAAPPADGAVAESQDRIEADRAVGRSETRVESDQPVMQTTTRALIGTVALITQRSYDAKLLDGVELGFTGCWDVPRQMITTYRVTPTKRVGGITHSPFELVRNAGSEAASADLDLLLLQNVAGPVLDLFGQGGRFVLALPVSATTLLGPRYLSRWAEAWKSHPEALRKLTRLWVYDVPADLPQTRMVEMMNLLRQLAQPPIVVTPADGRLIAPLGGHGAHAMAMTLPDFTLPGRGQALAARFAQALPIIVKRAHALKMRMLIQGVPDRQYAAVVLRAGCSYVEVPGLLAPEDLKAGAQPLDAAGFLAKLEK